MQIKKGKSRVVILVPMLGIAVKIARVYPCMAVLVLYGCFRRGSFWKRLKMACTIPAEFHLGFKGALFGGLIVNWREYQFYRQTNHPFVQPTYASFFGIFNIQQLGRPCCFTKGDLSEQFSLLTNTESFEDAHHFANPQNFCFDYGKLRILDYGGLICRSIIERHGLQIFEQFNPAYSCQVEFEKRMRETQKKIIN